MAVIDSGKPAVTHYRILQRFRAHTYLKVNLETGRTHQIRVHMAHIRYPLVGDPLYGGRLKLPRGAGEMLVETLRRFRRQALHAMRLSLLHPLSGEQLSWEAPLPEDMQGLLAALEADMVE
jgi:23S rRNA pseudouridine1911/1915/1917 synthase